MNNTINLNYLTRLSGNLSGSGTIQHPAAQNKDFLSMAEQLKMEQAAPARAASEAEDMSLEAYKQSIWRKISDLPMSAS